MKKKDLDLLLSINEAIAKTQDSETLFKNIFEKLLQSCHFKIAGVAILKKDKTAVELFLKGIDSPEDNLLPLDLHTIIPLANAPIKISFEAPETKRLQLKNFSIAPEIKRNTVFVDLIKKFRIQEIVYIPLMIAGELIGYQVLAYPAGCPATNDEITFLEQAANQMAVLLSVILAYETIYRSERFKEIQLELTNIFVSIKDRDKLFKKFAEEINKLISINYISINFCKLQDKRQLTISFIKNKEGKFSEMQESTGIVPIDRLKPYLNSNIKNNYFEFTDAEFTKLTKQSAHFRYLSEKENIKSVFHISYKSENAEEINLIISKDGKKVIAKIPYAVGNTIFEELEIDLIQKLAPQLLLILDNYFVYEEVDHLRKNLEQEKLFLLDEINLANSFQQIIGNSPAIHLVQNKIKQVAPLDATVLIQGETGTGKELAAQAIHNLSGRSDKAFIKINCAALPAQLIESELFGHEKGSFTGAIEKRLGKFELANHGTIFLDEIGEMPVELQPKLLRVLQEKQFERIGGSTTLSTDVRVVAATNRNLEKEVEEGNFRADLFFRLNVFPIVIPPLRERLEDIPLFIKFFLEKYSKSMGLPLKSVRKSDLELLQQYNWPGNIRELEHVIERALITSTKPHLELSDFIMTNNIRPEADPLSVKPLAEMEKEYIIAALNITNGKVTGENGAAKLLGINGKTLASKMKKLGIKRDFIIRTEHS